MEQKKKNKLTYQKYEKKVQEKIDKYEGYFKQGKYGAIVSWKMNKSKLAGYKIALILKNREFIGWLKYMKRRYKGKEVPLGTITEKIMELNDEKLKIHKSGRGRIC